MFRYLKIGMAALCLLLVVIFGGLTARRMLAPDYTVYDRELWIAEQSANASENRRSVMVDDIERHLRIGMTKLEIVDLLGQPDSISEQQFSYSLGMPGFGVDYASFIIEFDVKENVARWRVDHG